MMGTQYSSCPQLTFPDSPMKLLEFPHSHYCEKARWALDFKNISYQRVALMPGFHMRTVRRHAPQTSVPVLLTGTEVVQGSSEIIDYLDRFSPERGLTPLDKPSQDMCRQLEQEAGENLGEPLRTILYDRLLAYPDFIRFCFTHPMPAPKRFVFRLYYPFLRRLMHQVYVQSEEKVAEAKSIFFASLDELEARIGADRYLLDGRFTRADLSICSMLSLLVLPPQFPVAWPEMPDGEIREIMADCRDHPVCVWVRQMYDQHRKPQSD